MDSSSGLGRPGPGQPEFDRPADASWSSDAPPPRFGGPASAPETDHRAVPEPWGPPSLSASGSAGGPSGPGRRGPGVRTALLASAVISVVALGLLAWQLLPATPAATPSRSAAPVTPMAPTTDAQPSVVRTPATPGPTTSSAVTGGSIEQHVRYRTSDGQAQVTVTKASWVDNGALQPGHGLSYLVLDVRFESLDGTVVTGPFLTAVREPGGTRNLIAVGAALNHPLTMRTLSTGQSNTGQVAFELARGPVTFEVLDELLEPAASVEVPG